MGPFLSTEGDQPLVEVIYQKRFLSRGPKVVVIGGGTGTFTVLTGLKKYPFNLTAIVAMSDSGGSTGILRDELGVNAIVPEAKKTYELI